MTEARAAMNVLRSEKPPGRSRNRSSRACTCAPGYFGYDWDMVPRSDPAVLPPRLDTATSMREGFVLYDAQGEELWACFNGDARAADEVVELTERGLGPGLYERGGDWFAISAPPRLLWIKRHQPEVYARTAHLTMLGDWVLYRLTGEQRYLQLMRVIEKDWELEGDYLRVDSANDFAAGDRMVRPEDFCRQREVRCRSMCLTGAPPASATCTMWVFSRPAKAGTGSTASSFGAPASMQAFRRRPRISWEPANGPPVLLRWAFI